MSEADGEVRIKVNLDSNEVDKDIEKLQKTLKEQTASLEKQENAVDKLREKYDKLAQSLGQKIDAKEVELGVNKIKEKITELTDIKQDLSLVPKPDTRAIASTEKQITDLQYSLAEMKKKAADDPSFSGLKNSMSELKKEIDFATQSQEALRDKISQTKKALDGLENQKLAGTEGAFNKIKNSLNSAKNSLENLKNLMGKAGPSDVGSGAFKGIKEGMQSSQSEAQGLSGKIGDVFGNLGRKVEGFSSRIFRLASSAFVFNVISSGFREMARRVQTVIAQDSALSSSLSMVSSNLFTAFYPIYQAILPALRALGQGLAWVTGQIAAFIAMLTGTSVRANQLGAQMMTTKIGGDSGKISKSAKALGDQAKGYDKVGKAAQKAKGELASFDKIEVLRQNHEKNQKTPKASGGSGSGGVGSLSAGFAKFVDMDT